MLQPGLSNNATDNLSKRKSSVILCHDYKHIYEQKKKQAEDIKKTYTIVRICIVRDVGEITWYGMHFCFLQIVKRRDNSFDYIKHEA